MSDYTPLIGKTIKRAYIDADYRNLLLGFTDETWYNMSCPIDNPETIFFTHITGHQFLFDGYISAIDIIDQLDVSFTTNNGTVLFNAMLVSPNYINGILDVYPVSDVYSFDEHIAVRDVYISNEVSPQRYTEIMYELLVEDF